VKPNKYKACINGKWLYFGSTREAYRTIKKLRSDIKSNDAIIRHPVGLKIKSNEIALYQITEIYDRNMVDVYEGDIVSDSMNREWIIGYYYRWDAFIFRWPKETKDVKCRSMIIPCQLPIVIVGNVHNEPETRKEKK